MVIILILLTDCSSKSLAVPLTAHEMGKVSEGQDVYGNYFLYVPTVSPEQAEILVLVHGTPPKNETAEWNAEYFAKSWENFAEENGLILIAPAFNQEDFSSRRGDHARSGYRGLFGREISADEWVLRLVEAYRQAFGIASKQFYLYGHSAGGQFVGRFMVSHPELVKNAVISSAATYPQPSPEINWPFGMGELHADIVWDSESTTRVDVEPNKQDWLAATQIPLTVIVGLDDTTELPAHLIPGQRGKNRITIAENWVRDMSAFAEANGMQGRFKIDLIPGIGHSMIGLINFSQNALLSH